VLKTWKELGDCLGPKTTKNVEGDCLGVSFLEGYTCKEVGALSLRSDQKSCIIWPS